MHSSLKMAARFAAVAVLAALSPSRGHADEPNATPPTIDAAQLFGTVCGYCHADGGRAAGKGPQLMNTKRSDDFIRLRIMNGKEGAMPAFGATLSYEDIDAIIAYIHGLKPEAG